MTAVSEPLVPPMPAVAPTVGAGVPWWRRSLAWCLAGVVIGAGATGAAWGISAASAPDTFTLHGELVLQGAGSSEPDGDECAGDGGYGDIAGGAQVTVYDGAGATVATGYLDAGHRSGGLSSCRFPFTIGGVPEGSAFYAVEVTHRGKITVSAHEAETLGVSATLGD